jgi:hypothetical protein
MSPTGEYHPEWPWPCDICTLPAFKKCPTCGLEWRGAKSCPNCALTFAGYNKVQAERDQARDWCRMLVAHEKMLMAECRGFTGYLWAHGYTDAWRDSQKVYCALPPELRAAIGEAE